jgi:hypothetical protein
MAGVDHLALKLNHRRQPHWLWHRRCEALVRHWQPCIAVVDGVGGTGGITLLVATTAVTCTVIVAAPTAGMSRAESRSYRLLMGLAVATPLTVLALALPKLAGMRGSKRPASRGPALLIKKLNVVGRTGGH